MDAADKTPYLNQATVAAELIAMRIGGLVKLITELLEVLPGLPLSKPHNRTHLHTAGLDSDQWEPNGKVGVFGAKEPTERHHHEERAAFHNRRKFRPRLSWDQQNVIMTIPWYLNFTESNVLDKITWLNSSYFY